MARRKQNEGNSPLELLQFAFEQLDSPVRRGNRLSYTPYPKQEEFHRSPCLGRYVAGANRAGKSDSEVMEAIWWCTDTHPYQTFIAIQLPEPPRTQSALENNPVIQALCNKAVLNQRLAEGRAGAVWDIQVIPYRVFPDPDDLSRCVFSTGKERTSPLALKPV